jgi:hypothetical protein
MRLYFEAAVASVRGRVRLALANERGDESLSQQWALSGASNRHIASLSDWRQKEYLADTRYLDRCLHAYRRFFRHWSMVRKARGV